MTERDIKFFDRNKSNFDKLNEYIDEQGKNIRLIICSPEMYGYLGVTEHAVHYPEDATADEITALKYKGVRVILEPYMPASHVNIMLRSNAIEFDMPCVCGIYKDEVHP